VQELLTGRIKGNYEDVAFVTNGVWSLARKFDNHSGHVSLELTNADGKDWIKVDAARHQPGANVSPGAIQNQAIWTGQLKRSTRKPAIADDLDLDVLTKVNRLNFLDQCKIGFYRSFRNSRMLRGHVQC
jgi:hypothetical protein